MGRDDERRVHLLAGRMGPHSGISRYSREIHQRLRVLVPIDICQFRTLPLARRFAFLQHLPVGIQPHHGTGVYHFTRIMGSAMMLWRPVHPAIGAIHDLGPLVLQEDRRAMNAFDYMLFRLQVAGLKRMDWFVVNSEHTRRTVIKTLGVREDRIEAVQFGVDMEHFRPIPHAADLVAQRHGIRKVEGVVDVLYVGNEHPRKNLSMLLEALAILKARGHRLRLIKVGRPHGEQWRVRLRQQTRELRLEDEVAFVGPVTEADLPLFYNVADVYVHPTLIEGGFSWPCMEAMACGTAVVATQAALVPRRAQGGALIVHSRRLNELVDALEACVKDPELRSRLGAAGQIGIAPFTWDSAVEQLLGVYDKVFRHSHETRTAAAHFPPSASTRK